MEVAILAIPSPSDPANGPGITDLAGAVWIGGAAMSACGVFILQYMPTIAITMSDEEILVLLDGDISFLSQIFLLILTLVVAMPNVIACWSSVLFVAGILDYIRQNKYKKTYELTESGVRWLSTLPAAVGVVSVLFTVLVGFVVSNVGDRRLRWRLQREQVGFRCDYAGLETYPMIRS